METKARIDTYSHAETLLEKLFRSPTETFMEELKKASAVYFQPTNDNDPKEEKEIQRNIDAIINHGIICSSLLMLMKNLLLAFFTIRIVF